MVHFGTSGWRGVVGKEITFRKVRIVTQALLDTLKAQGEVTGPIVIGYDTRMLSEKFMSMAARLVSSNGFQVLVTARDVPSPVVSSVVRECKASAGLMFTGSHNAPEYNGLKIYTADGSQATAALTDLIESRYAELDEGWDDIFLSDRALISEHDSKPAYLSRLRELIDWEAIRKRGLSVVVDPLFGSAREYLDHILLENGVETTVIHNTRDPFFGGYAPNCSSENLTRLRDVMRRRTADLGLATDGDGDRFGILDHGARLCRSSSLIALILDYLARRRGLTGAVGRSLATSTLIDAVAAEHGLDLVEGPVGFKYFGPMLADGRLAFAGEESAGLAWGTHLPERDGILACLLTVEMVAVEGKTLHELNKALAARVGGYHFRRIQLPVTQSYTRNYNLRLEQEWTEIDGRPIVRVDRSDGLKLVFEGGAWLLIRLAGTEPRFRLYVEGRSAEEMRYLIHQARRLFSDWRT